MNVPDNWNQVDDKHAMEINYKGNQKILIRTTKHRTQTINNDDDKNISTVTSILFLMLLLSLHNM
jgi:hypothetical protein